MMSGEKSPVQKKKGKENNRGVPRQGVGQGTAGNVALVPAPHSALPIEVVIQFPRAQRRTQAAHAHEGDLIPCNNFRASIKS
jgi:hypothetical protein